MVGRQGEFCSAVTVAMVATYGPPVSPLSARIVAWNRASDSVSHVVTGMERKTPRRKDVPWFWGCTRYKAVACPGKREQDGSSSSARHRPKAEDPVTTWDTESEAR